MQHVEEERRQRRDRPGGRDVDPRDARLPVSWNGRGRPSGRNAIASPSSTSVAHRQRQRRLDHLGHPAGDVVEGAGEDRHLAPVAVHLDPDAVELPLDRGLAQLGRARRRCRWRSRRASAAPAGRPRSRNSASAAAPPVSAAAATGPTAPRSIAARRTSAGGTLGGRRHGVEHHALERSLPQLAGEQPAQQLLLAAVARPNSAGQPAPARPASPALRAPAMVVERRVDLADGQRRLGRRRRQVAQRGPADAGAPLRQLAGQVGDHDGHLVGVRRTQASATGATFAVRAGGRRDGL